MPVVSGTQYASQSDLAQLGLIAGVLASISGTTQDAALLAASAIADSYLQSRYDLPLVNWGKDLVRIVCHIAAHDLMGSKGYNPSAGADPQIQYRRDKAIEWLQEVSEERQTPAYVVDSTPGGGSATPTSSDGAVVTTTEGGLQMTTSSVRGWTRRGQTSSSGTEFWDGNR